VVPTLLGFYLSVSGCASVLRSGAWLCAIEVFPSVHGLHSLANAQGEGGPVGAIRFEVGNISGWILDGGDNGEHEVKSWSVAEARLSI
jgi:hypothetical protein